MHVLWDWNGTLLDDTDACVAALNRMLARRGLPSVTLSAYRDTFAFPVRDYYRRIGFRLEEEDWDALAREYHAAYLAQPCGLTDGAIAALEAVRARGGRQSIISALRQDLLDEATEAYGVRGYFDRVVGSDNLNGGSKLERARGLLKTLTGAGDAPEDIVLIGDALHDAEVARALGIRCVLFSGGGHAAWRLAAVAPVAPTLMQCLGRIEGDGRK